VVLILASEVVSVLYRKESKPATVLDITWNFDNTDMSSCGKA